MGVVTNPGLTVTSTTAPGPASDVSTTGWATPTDWETCEFRVFDDARAASAAFKSGVPRGMKRACEHLRGAEFRSPQLWVDRRRNRKARAVAPRPGDRPERPEDVVLAVRRRGRPRPSRSPASPTRRCRASGRLYFNWDELERPHPAARVVVRERDDPRALPRGPGGVRLPRQVVDDRDSVAPPGAWGSWRGRRRSSGRPSSRTRTGSTAGTFPSGSRSRPRLLLRARPLALGASRPTPARTSSPTWPSAGTAGACATFGGSSSTFPTRRTASSESRPTEYYTLYRKAMDFHYQSAFGITLPELYAEFALDRAYRHDPPALLRAVDGEPEEELARSEPFRRRRRRGIPPQARPLELEGHLAARRPGGDGPGLRRRADGEEAHDDSSPSTGATLGQAGSADLRLPREGRRSRGRERQGDDRRQQARRGPRRSGDDHADGSRRERVDRATTSRP